MRRKLDYPDTRIDRVTKTVGAVTFDDPYSWLQSDTVEALEWQWRQDAIAQTYVREWPHFAQLRESVARFESSLASYVRSPPRLRGRHWFWTAPTAQSARALWVGEQPDSGRPLVENERLATRPEDAASLLVYWYEPSPDGEYVALICNANGDMYGVWCVVEVATARVLDLAVPGAAFTGALPGWLPDASGFFIGDRLPDSRHRLRFIAVKEHATQLPEVVFELTEVPTVVAGLTPEVSPDGRYVLALAGHHRRIAKAVGDLRSGEWRSVLPPDYHGECSGAWLDERSYVARVHDTASRRGRIVAIPIPTSQDASTWRELVPESQAVLCAVGVARNRIVVSDILSCSARFRTFDLQGGDERLVPLEGPGNSLIAAQWRRFDASDAFTFDHATFTRRHAIYRCDLDTHELRVIGTAADALSGIVVAQRFATSLDGTSVPYFLVHDEKVDPIRPQPTLLTGYGGFNVAFLPTYLGHLLPFIRAGGVLAHANLRGGGEHGPGWHEAGRLASKWNVFLDLFAVAENLIARNVTTPDRLAMMGASNGGLLAGAAIAHRPDLFRVVVPVVPTFDEMEPLPPGAAYEGARSIHFAELGDPQDPVMSKVLRSYSPYHNIREGVRYPAVFQIFGEKDISCMPFHGRKLTARLQACTAAPHPVLLRVWKDTGHAAADAETAIGQATEWLAFVMRELGMTPATTQEP